DRRLAWAAADGRLMQAHHLVGLRRLLSLVVPADDSGKECEGTGDEGTRYAIVEDWHRRLDAILDVNVWRGLERGGALSEEQDALLRSLLAEVPEWDPSRVEYPMREDLLTELGR